MRHDNPNQLKLRFDAAAPAGNFPPAVRNQYRLQLIKSRVFEQLFLDFGSVEKIPAQKWELYKSIKRRADKGA